MSADRAIRAALFVCLITTTVAMTSAATTTNWPGFRGPAANGTAEARDVHKGLPFGGRHRKNTYSSETPFTDGERLYVSFGQNIGMFAFTLDGTPLWKKTWPPHLPRCP